ncbi:hypothetical protein JCM10908_002415 [Rhodotorula pacifica]|uniref:ATP synthase subunit H n=1 Tax=Rhodotorula pacifica TaxID=1495444 RepID=UPI00318099A1
MFARRALQAARPLARSFSAQQVARKDFVQELYVKELRAYKPKPAASAQGATKSYSTPTAPKAPVVPDANQLAQELEAYDSAAPVDAAAPSAPGIAAEATEGDEAALGADEYLKLCEQPVHAAKH